MSGVYLNFLASQSEHLGVFFPQCYTIGLLVVPTDLCRLFYITIGLLQPNIYSWIHMYVGNLECEMVSK